MATYILSGVLAVTIGALLWTQVRHGRAFAVQMEALGSIAQANDALRASQELVLDTADTGQILALANELSDLRADQEQLKFAVAEGIQHVERVENRIKATVRRARKELAEFGHVHDGLEAEASELRLIDGGGSEEQGMLPLPQELGPAESSVPGVSAEQLARVRGA